MSWYYFAIELFCWIVMFIMLRHMLMRGRYLLHAFQQNGYKINEFSSWLAHRWSSMLFPAPHLGIILLSLAGMHYVEPVITTSATAVTLFIFTVFVFGKVSGYPAEKVKKPLVFTARMIRLVAVFVLFSLLLPMIGSVYAFHTGVLFPDMHALVIAWVFADLILPYLLVISSALIYPLESIIQYRYKWLAGRKIRSMPDLKVIAITGSYGKTSTKFLIDAVLKERYRVCTTPGSYNTPMGICKVINNDLQPGDQVLILEMGARYVGNIDELCRIASPDIAVITNVGVAHLETFGSVDAIAETKGALLRYLKPGGLAVLNGDDDKVRGMPIRDGVPVIYAGMTAEKNHIFSDSIHYDENGCTFSLTVDPDEMKAIGETVRQQTITMPLLGQHNIHNAMLAAGAGLVMGLRLPTIKVALGKVSPVAHRLELKKRNGVIVIDDAFNSNPVGARNAVSVLSGFKTGRKYIITPGMIELGGLQREENHKLGLWIAEHAPDHVYLVGREQTKPLFDGLIEGYYPEEQITVVKSLFDANDLLKQRLAEGDVVLYENDLPDTYSENG